MEQLLATIRVGDHHSYNIVHRQQLCDRPLQRLHNGLESSNGAIAERAVDSLKASTIAKLRHQLASAHIDHGLGDDGCVEASWFLQHNCQLLDCIDVSGQQCSRITNYTVELDQLFNGFVELRRQCVTQFAR